MHPHLPSPALLGLLRWVSPTLPVGAYAYSRGLEYAVHAGWVHDEATALAWVGGVLREGVAALDAPIARRVHAAWLEGDERALHHWNDYLAASRESAELSLEDTQMGAAFARVLDGAGLLEGQPLTLPTPVSYVAAFAVACALSQVDGRHAVLGLLWATLESQVGAAVRLVPLGQSAGQRMIAELSQELPGLTERALARPDHELGASLPALALGSALHETQYTRLFRS